MNFEVQYHEDVVRKDIPRLSATAKKQIKKAIEQKIVIAPEHFGKPLRRSLKGYRKLRVADYRVIFRIEGNIVKIFLIQHRSVVYQNAAQRLFN
ncbi:type II toxin-antitoxin system RelE/ParE family toxin [Candidatus Peregrinibacteria bacterium]|nr:type II toxin-antitoxin system RelE/ParE family toxin [Candidatus Peregrinibacteria bacterium]